MHAHPLPAAACAAIACLALAACGPTGPPPDAILVQLALPARPALGCAVPAGDVDRDGCDDLLIGSTSSTRGTVEAVAFVFSSKTGRSLLELHTRATLRSSSSVVAAAGDANGDGWPDLLLSDPGVPAADLPGHVWLFSGRDAALLHEWSAEQASDRFGGCVAGLGDLDLDGGAELFVGATQLNFDGPTSEWLASGPGYARVYSGMTGEVLFELRGRANGDGLGASACGLGDVDGDGRFDFAIGTDTYGGAAYALLVSGADGRVLRTLEPAPTTSSGGVRVEPVAARGGSLDCALITAGRARIVSSSDGRTLAEIPTDRWYSRVVGDFDFDGCADLAGCDMGWRGADPCFDVGGIDATLYSGRTGAALATTFFGPPGFPPQLSPLGDLDGDRVPELLLSHGGVFVLSGARFFGRAR